MLANVCRYVAVAVSFAVARVFALAVRCRVMMLFVYCRVGKNRDTRRESPAAAGAACAAGHKTVLFSQVILAAQKAMPYTGLLGTVAASKSIFRTKKISLDYS
jgi:hypothetical protein